MGLTPLMGLFRMDNQTEALPSNHAAPRNGGAEFQRLRSQESTR